MQKGLPKSSFSEGFGFLTLPLDSHRACFMMLAQMPADEVWVDTNHFLISAKAIVVSEGCLFHLQATGAFEIVAPKMSYFHTLEVANSYED